MLAPLLRSPFPCCQSRGIHCPICAARRAISQEHHQCLTGKGRYRTLEKYHRRTVNENFLQHIQGAPGARSTRIQPAVSSPAGDPVYFHGFHIPREPKAPGPDGVNIMFRSGGIINESRKRSTLDFLETRPREKVTNARRRNSRIHSSFLCIV
jgi:hypothetical protein